MKLRSRTVVESLQPGPSPIPHSRKRRLGHESPPNSAPPAKRARLTAKNLQLHASASSPKDMPNKRDRTGVLTSSTSTTTRTKTTDPRFGDKLTRNGVVHEQSYVRQPDDYAAVRADLDRSRASGSPCSDDWRTYRRIVERATNEDAIRGLAFPRLLKQPKYDEDLYEQVMNQEWTEIDEADVTRNLSNPKPDYTESFGIQSYPEEAQSTLGGHLQPSAYHHGMPRFAVELKQPFNGERQAHRQAAYDGAVMASAARAQDEYKGQTFAYGQTQALTVASNGENVGFYANHAIESQGGTQFHHVELFHNTPCQTKDEFSSTRKRVRNAQDWGRTRASEARNALRQHVDGITQLTPPTTGTVEEQQGKWKRKVRRTKARRQTTTK